MEGSLSSGIQQQLALTNGTLANVTSGGPATASVAPGYNPFTESEERVQQSTEVATGVSTALVAASVVTTTVLSAGVVGSTSTSSSAGSDGAVTLVAHFQQMAVIGLLVSGGAAANGDYGAFVGSFSWATLSMNLGTWWSAAANGLAAAFGAPTAATSGSRRRLAGTPAASGKFGGVAAGLASSSGAEPPAAVFSVIMLCLLGAAVVLCIDVTILLASLGCGQHCKPCRPHAQRSGCFGRSCTRSKLRDAVVAQHTLWWRISFLPSVLAATAEVALVASAGTVLVGLLWLGGWCFGVVAVARWWQLKRVRPVSAKTAAPTATTESNDDDDTPEGCMDVVVLPLYKSLRNKVSFMWLVLLGYQVLQVLLFGAACVVCGWLTRCGYIRVW